MISGDSEQIVFHIIHYVPAASERTENIFSVYANTKKCILAFLIPILAFAVSFADSAQAQHSIGLNTNFSTTLGNNFYSPDFGTEVELSYLNTLLHVKNDLYLFGRLSAFYQPKAFSAEVNYVTGSSQYDRYRYGGSVAAGFFIAGPVIHTEIGVGISRHFIEFNKIQD